MDRRTALKVTASAISAIGLSILLGNKALTPISESLVNQTELPVKLNDDSIDWVYWLSVNPNIIGWIRISDSAVDYPIVQASPEDPTYYLRHGIRGEESVYGTPYLDSGNMAKGLLSPLCWIFGHNMTDGKMFAPIASYTEVSFAESHPQIRIDTPDGSIRNYLVDGVKLISEDNRVKRTDVTTSKAAQAWYEAMLASADTIIADSSNFHDSCNYALFSTCTNDGTARVLVLTHCAT